MSDGVTYHKLRRATGTELKSVFEKYASVNSDGVWYMTPKDFLVNYLGLPVECEGMVELYGRNQGFAMAYVHFQFKEQVFVS